MKHTAPFFLSILAVAYALGGCERQGSIHSPRAEETVTSVTFKNESQTELQDARLVVDNRSFGYGIVGGGGGKTMGVCQISEVKKLTVYYAITDAEWELSDTDRQPHFEIPSAVIAKMRPFAGVATDIVVSYRGAKKWTVRLLNLNANHDKKVIFEHDVNEPEKE